MTISTSPLPTAVLANRLRVDWFSELAPRAHLRPRRYNLRNSVNTVLQPDWSTFQAEESRESLGTCYFNGDIMRFVVSTEGGRLSLNSIDLLSELGRYSFTGRYSVGLVSFTMVSSINPGRKIKRSVRTLYYKGFSLESAEAFGSLTLAEEKLRPLRPACTLTFKLQKGETDHFEHLVRSRSAQTLQ